jgi:hypothetical protein
MCIIKSGLMLKLLAYNVGGYLNVQLPKIKMK